MILPNGAERSAKVDHQLDLRRLGKRDLDVEKGLPLHLRSNFVNESRMYVYSSMKP